MAQDANYLGEAGGPPTFGTFAAGLWLTDTTNGGFWICTAAGSPGTWVHVSNLSAANTYTGAQTFSGTSTFSGASTFSTGPVLSGCALTIPEGSNAYMGTVAVNGTNPITVATTALTGNSRIFMTINAPGGTPGSPYVFSQSTSTNFVIKSQASDTSTVAWMIVNHT